jgi:hypothetical protein
VRGVAVPKLLASYGFEGTVALLWQGFAGDGVPREAFTPVFAVSRSAGWLAHAMEQRATGRMIRPASRYVGVTAVT